MESEEWKAGADDAMKFLTDPESIAALTKQVRSGKASDRRFFMHQYS